MRRFKWGMLLLLVLGGVVASAASSGPLDAPFPARINFPFPQQFDPVTGVAAIPGWTPEGIALYGNFMFSPNTGTCEVLRVDLQSGAIVRNFVPASPASPDPAHR